MTIQQAILKRINELLYLHGKKLSEVAYHAGITASTFYSVSARQQSNPTVKTIKVFCDGLGITLREFFSTEYFDNLSIEEN